MRTDSQRRPVRTEVSRFALMQRERWSRCIATTASRLEMVLVSEGVRRGLCALHAGSRVTRRGAQSGKLKNCGEGGGRDRNRGLRTITFGGPPCGARTMWEGELSCRQREKKRYRASSRKALERELGLVRRAEDGSSRAASPAVSRRAPVEWVPVTGAEGGGLRGGLRHSELQWLRDW